VVTDATEMMTKIVEKPKEPISKRANIGLYYVKNWKLLFEGIEHVLKSPPNKGEFYLTDAFQYMIEHGAKLKVVDVEGWYDAGQVETLLDTNRVMLEKGRARKPAPTPGVTVVDPVYVEDGVTLRDCTIGPNVSIGSGTTIEGAVISHSVVGHKAQIRHSRLEGSLVGDHAVLAHVKGTVSVGDHAVVLGGG
jgi:glucose-1-phosphate thymidylyltransferase